MHSQKKQIYINIRQLQEKGKHTGNGKQGASAYYADFTFPEDHGKVETADAYQAHNDPVSPQSEVGEETLDCEDDQKYNTVSSCSTLDDASTVEAAELDATAFLADHFCSCGGFQSPLIRVGCLVCVWCVSGVFGASVARQGCPRVFSLSFSPSPSLPLRLSLSFFPPLLSPSSSLPLSLSSSPSLSPSLSLSVPPSVSCCGGFVKRGDDQSDHETLLILLLTDWTNDVTRLRAVPVDPGAFDTLCKTKNAHHCYGSSPHSSAKLQSNGCLVKVVLTNGAPQTT